MRGLIDPSDLGRTLMHEHLLYDLRPLHRQAPWDPDGSFARLPSTPRIRARVQWDWFSNLDELYLDDEALITDEVRMFKAVGGKAIVDCTTMGLARDPEAIRRVSEATGVHVTMGAGYYQDRCLPASFDALTEEQITDEIVRDIETGVGDTGIRAGHIGEIGVQTPTERELRSLRAAARAQGRTGAMLNVHQSYAPGDRATQHMLADTIEANGGDLRRTVFSHMDRTGQDLEQQLSLLRRGITVEYDEFGYEVGNRAWDRSSIQDVQRVREIARLAEAGFLDQLAVAHDISFKRMLVTNGGWGFGHLLERVVDGFKWAGLSDDDVDQLFVRTPRRLLTFVAPTARAANRPSEVVSALKALDDQGPAGLVDRDALAAWGTERACRAHRQFQGPAALPATTLERCHGGIQILDAIDEDRAISVEVAGEQDARRTRCQLDHGDARAHPVDCEDSATAQDVREPRRIRFGIAAGHVHVVQSFERGVAHPRQHDPNRARPRASKQSQWGALRRLWVPDRGTCIEGRRACGAALSIPPPGIDNFERRALVKRREIG